MADHNTSELACYVRGSTARLAAKSPVDTGDARDGVVNNLNHIEDSAGQCLANILGRTAGKAAWDGDISSVDFTRVASMPPLPVCLRILADGFTSRLVIRLDAQITVAGTATWRFALTPLNRAMTLPPPAASLGFPNTVEISTTSTSVVELGPILLYAGASAGFLQSMPSLDASGAASSASILLAQIEVWSFSSSTGIPRISALTVQEWVA